MVSSHSIGDSDGMDTLRTSYGVLVPIHEYVWASPYYWRFSMGATFDGPCVFPRIGLGEGITESVEKRGGTDVLDEDEEEGDHVSWIDIATVDERFYGGPLEMQEIKDAYEDGE